MKYVDRRCARSTLCVGLLALSLLTTGCTGIRLFGLSTDHKQLRAQIMKSVPPGTSVETAASTMRRRGFDCEEVHLASFRDYTSASNYRVFSNVNCLRCRGRRIVPLVSDYVWFIGLAYDADRVVTNVMVQVTASSL
jgi:hypothetical protein